MNPSRPFILRPVATSLLMVAILLSGALAYRLLPLSALPEVDYPTIQVVTFYPGASPDVMTSSVTAPLERQFGQMPGLKQMSSTSSGGASVITLQFSLDLGLDVAEQEVQAAINAGSNFLPTDLPAPPVYSKVNPADAPILTLGLTSATLPLPKIEDLADTRLAQKISQLTGVGLVTISGGQRPAVRVALNPKALAANGLGLEDVRVAVANATSTRPRAASTVRTRAYTIDANDQIQSAAQYANVVIAYRNGAPVRLSDLGTVSRRRRERTPGRLDERRPGGDRQYPAPAWRQRDRGRRPHQAAAAAAARRAAGVDRRRAAHRPHHDDPRLGARRAIRAAARGGPRSDGDLPVPAQRCGDRDSERRGAAVAGRHLRRDVPGWLQHQQPHA